MSRQATRAGETRRGMPCAARERLSAYPGSSADSCALRPCALSTLIALTG